MSPSKNSSGKMSGENIDFIVAKAQAGSAVDTKAISGNVLNFTINNIGRWTLEEKKAAVCMICKLSLKSDQTITQCPMCDSFFHQNHIVEWLRVKGKCPVCRQSLRPDSLKRVKL